MTHEDYHLSGYELRVSDKRTVPYNPLVLLIIPAMDFGVISS